MEPFKLPPVHPSQLAQYNPRTGKPLSPDIGQVADELRRRRSYRGIVKPVLTVDQKKALQFLLDWYLQASDW